MKPKGLQLDYLWRFKGLRFYVGWFHFKSKGFCMTKYGYWFMKVYDVCKGWKFKSKVLKTQGFMKIWIQCLWNRIPRLELANHNGLWGLVFPYCGHHSWWNLGWAKGLFFELPIFTIWNSCFSKGCKFIPTSWILIHIVCLFFIFASCKFQLVNLQSCHHYFSCALQSCSYLVIDFFVLYFFYHYSIIVPPFNLKWKLILVHSLLHMLQHPVIALPF